MGHAASVAVGFKHIDLIALKQKVISAVDARGARPHHSHFRTHGIGVALGAMEKIFHGTGGIGRITLQIFDIDRGIKILTAAGFFAVADTDAAAAAH